MSLFHDKIMLTLKVNNLCINCLRPGHFFKLCKSLHSCRKCLKPHHTLPHVEAKEGALNPPSPIDLPVKTITSNMTAGLTSISLLMTCCILIDDPDGSSVKAQCILDSASSASFVSDCLVQTLFLPQSHQGAKISGVTDLTNESHLQSIANFRISAVGSSTKKVDVAAVVFPRITFDLPLHSIPFDTRWNTRKTSHCLIHTLDALEEVISVLEYTYFCCRLMQGCRLAPLVPQLHLKPCLVGVLREKPILACTLLLTMLTSSHEMTCFASFGR